MSFWIDASPLDTMDDATAALIAQLQLQDSRDEFEAAAGKGKMVENSLSDNQHAFQLIREDMECRATMLDDRKMAVSMRKAIRTDSESIMACIAEEQVEQSDRNMALRLGGVAPPPLEIEAAPAGPEIDDRMLELMEALYVQEPVEVADDNDETTELDSEYGGNAGESSQWALTRSNPPRPHPRVECVVCGDHARFFDTTPVACGETYCRACLQELFQSSFTDEGRFPPKCCGQAILPESVRLFLSADIVEKYAEKKLEFETPNRTYCSVPTCSTFLRLENIHADCGTCPACTAQTCTICKAEWHGNQDCPSDTGLQLVLATADREGWKRCICGRLIELGLGCHHMTCPCGHQFCYECGAVWRTCQCAHFREDRLLATALDQVVRRPAAPGADMDQQVAAAARRLIFQHECDHDWEWTAGAAECDECGDFYRRFTYVCGNCGRHHCADCRFNS